MAHHKDKALALVSRRSGKKSSTSFTRINAHGKASLWEAITNLPRLDQVRLHAAEVGIPVFGDNLYGLSKEADTGGTGRNQGRRPRFSGLAMYLGEMNLMSVPVAGAVLRVSPSKQFSVFCRKCGIELAE